ncbi:MAG: hypothetical protein EPN39_08680 [Chitinophagaceae bacterium]|nr:MAG: hypothetical protein EPN39_08680 [Chitinophagaceae bacterium]
MENVSEIRNTEETPIEIDPWTDIWIRPRKTINWVINQNKGVLINLIFIYFGGVYYGITNAESSSLGDSMSLRHILLVALLLSGLGGLISYNIFIWLISLSGTWLGGKGDFKNLQSAIAWTMIPAIAGLVLAIIGYIVFGMELFQSDKSYLVILIRIYGIIESILIIWHIVLTIITISEVQKFPISKAILSILIAVLIIAIPAIFIGYLARLF